MKKNAWRAVIEIAFIVFLFYANLLMGEFERSGIARKRGIVWAIARRFYHRRFEIAPGRGSSSATGFSNSSEKNSKHQSH